MKLIPDAMAQAESPSPPAAEAPAATPSAPPVPAPPGAAQPPTTTQTGQAANGQPEAQPPTAPEMFAQLIPIFVVMGIVYILVIRPRSRREKEQLARLRDARRGDTLVTTGGLVGKVTRSIDDSEVELEIAPNVRIRLLRTAIVEVRSKGEPVKDQPASPKSAKSGGKSGGAKTAETKTAETKTGEAKNDEA